VPTTITDVARHAGVSPATVSRVLNELSTVDAELAERVRGSMRELGYEPNRAARALRSQRARVWGVIISDIENPFFTGMVRGIEDVASDAGHSIVLCNSDGDTAKERQYVSVAIAEQMAGVIVTPASETETDLTPLTARGTEVVCVDRTPLQPDVDAVLLNNREGARRATAHLIEQGYSRIGFIGGPEDVTTARERRAGFRAAHETAKRRVHASYEVEGDFRRDGGYRAMEQLLRKNRKPDAVFVANNMMTVGAIEYLDRHDIRLATDIGFVAYDEQPWTQLVRPRITVVAQPVYEIGRRAAELLLGRLRDPATPRATVVLDPELRVRESSIRPAAKPRKK
jgi:LacI family transcriptional regulator